VSNPVGIFRERLSLPERVINWIGGEPPLIPRTPGENLQRMVKNYGLTVMSSKRAAPGGGGRDGGNYHYARPGAPLAIDFARPLSPQTVAWVRLHRGPFLARQIFDWATECPGDFIRRWPPVVGTGRGHILRKDE